MRPKNVDMLFEPITNHLPFKIQNYTLTRLVGQGGFSRCFLVESSKYPDKFCAKVVPHVMSHVCVPSDSTFLRELCNSNIVSYYDSFSDSNFTYLILEYLRGGPLTDLIGSQRLRDPNTLQYYSSHLLNGFAYCHENSIAHCDIKPANILLDERLHPKIIDFGISIKVQKGTLYETECASAPYSPPEVVLGNAHDPIKADIWSLGVTFYEMAVGNLPWPKDKSMMERCIEQGLFEIPAFVDSNFAKIIRAMLQVEPQKRPSLQSLKKLSYFQIQTPTKYTSIRHVLSSCFPSSSNPASASRKSHIDLYSVNSHGHTVDLIQPQILKSSTHKNFRSRTLTFI